MAGQQGTGKHPHKSSQEPYPHHEGQRGGEKRGAQQGGRGEEQRSSEAGRSGGDDRSLKEREYRDAQGNVHHHTKSYMEQHGKESGKK